MKFAVEALGGVGFSTTLQPRIWFSDGRYMGRIYGGFCGDGYELWSIST
jgi:hypothetical protein